jgi:hypothetical protein
MSASIFFRLGFRHLRIRGRNRMHCNKALKTSTVARHHRREFVTAIARLSLSGPANPLSRLEPPLEKRKRSLQAIAGIAARRVVVKAMSRARLPARSCRGERTANGADQNKPHRCARWLGAATVSALRNGNGILVQAILWRAKVCGGSVIPSPIDSIASYHRISR